MYIACVGYALWILWKATGDGEAALTQASADKACRILVNSTYACYNNHGRTGFKSDDMKMCRHVHTHTYNTCIRDTYEMSPCRLLMKLRMFCLEAAGPQLPIPSGVEARQFESKSLEAHP